MHSYRCKKQQGIKEKKYSKSTYMIDHLKKYGIVCLKNSIQTLENTMFCFIQLLTIQGIKEKKYSKSTYMIDHFKKIWHCLKNSNS
jgi:hypothetical protein